MRVLHFLPPGDSMITQHVDILTGSMGLEVENHVATDASKAKTLLQGGNYDILHLHGCWRNSSRTIVNMALRSGARLIVTPHGQLEPWVQDEGYWKEKLPKRIFYQRDIIRQAYAVIIQGKMESECMEKLGWNSRCIIIRNAIITRSITPKEMAQMTFALYRKVLDTNTLELMSDETRKTLKALIKAGITGDVRWLGQPLPPLVLSAEEWRKVLCYAHQEQISDVIARGIRVLHLDAPDLDASKIEHFLPRHYTPIQSIQSVIGNQFASENDRLLATFRHTKKLIANKTLTISHLCEIDRELRQHACEEDVLAETLKERQLWMQVRRLMQLMAELTGLTEGFMPVPPLNDRHTRLLLQQIENHLKL